MVYAFEINTSTFPAAKFATFSNILNLVLPVIIIGAALVFLAMFLYAGFTWVTSGDNVEKLKKAQSTMVYAVTGLFIVILSYLIVKLIGFIFNIKLPI